MKKIISLFYLLFFGTFITNAQNTNNLIFKDGNQTMKIEFETKQPYLEITLSHVIRTLWKQSECQQIVAMMD